MSAPRISIVIPVHNDESTIATALESCLSQTLPSIEIICVDDASTDGTAAVVENFARRDGRVRLLRHEVNLTALQSRRTGVAAASATYILFLDGDDELTPDAAQVALAHAETSGADLVGFGITVIESDGRTGGGYERRLQPRHDALSGSAVLRGLFPVGQPAQGQLWRFLFRTELLTEAYELVPKDLRLARVNDLPLMFLVAALATSYASVEDKLYRYHFGRGGSGHDIEDLDRAEFYVSAIRSIDSIRSAVDVVADKRGNADEIREAYESARLSLIGYVCSQLIDRSQGMDVLAGAMTLLHGVASATDVARGALRYYPRTVPVLKLYTPFVEPAAEPVRNILLAVSSLRTGGISAVVAAQARHLRSAGYTVTVLARSGGSDASVLPPDIPFLELTSNDLLDRLREWSDICEDRGIDVVIDHQVLYTRYWPEFAVASRAAGARTIGWIHNFIGRPILDQSDRLSLIDRCANTLSQLVALSPLDVAYFKLRGIAHTSYLPNPPSRLLLDAERVDSKRAPAGRLNLVWWGRLEQRTKRVYDLIEIGAHLKRHGVDFELLVIGPDWDDATSKKFNAEARRRKVSGSVRAIGPLRGQLLLDRIDAADAFVSTSVIEGFQLTIAEAQSRGLPVFMYELPWLTLVRHNDGIVTAPQGDAAGLARAIATSLRDSARFDALSRASLQAAQRELSIDFTELYSALVNHQVSSDYTPEPTLEDASALLGHLVFYAELANTPELIRPADTSSAGVRLWRSAAPLGRAVLQRLPGLRPLAHRAKGWLRAQG